jgi:hypothetical protein
MYQYNLTSGASRYLIQGNWEENDIFKAVVTAIVNGIATGIARSRANACALMSL